MAKTQQEIDAEKAARSRPARPCVARLALAAGRAMAYGENKHGLGASGEGTFRDVGTEQSKIRTHMHSLLRHLCEYLLDPDAREEGSGLSVLDHAAAQLSVVIDLHENPPAAVAPAPDAVTLYDLDWSPEGDERLPADGDPWELPDGWEWNTDIAGWCAWPPDGRPISNVDSRIDDPERARIRRIVHERNRAEPTNPGLGG